MTAVLKRECTVRVGATAIREWYTEIRDATYRLHSTRLFRSVSFLVSPLPPVNREAIAMRLLFAILLAVSVLSAVVHG
jgi:hypothetical protein